MLKCEFCEKEFKTKTIVNLHQKTTKYCLEKQGKELDNKYECQYCKNKFTRKERLNTHLEICSVKINDNKEKENKKIDKLETENKELKKQYNEMKELLENKNKELERQYDEMKELLENKNKLIDDLKFELKEKNKAIEKVEDKLYKILEKAVDKPNTNTEKLISHSLSSSKVESKEKEDIQNEINITEKYNILVKHNSSLKSHRYIKFKESGPCFYIIDSGISCCDRNIQYKFGIAGTNKAHSIDDRLQCHRTLWPLLHLWRFKPPIFIGL